MTIELTAPVAGDTSAAQEARNRRLAVLKGLHGAWVEYADDTDGGTVLRFVLLDADDELGR